MIGYSSLNKVLVITTLPLPKKIKQSDGSARHISKQLF